MANLNKVMLIGRLTRDPECRSFANGGKVAKISFAVNNRKKDPTSGQWVEDPVYIDIDAFNRETRKLADLVEQYLRKGSQVYIEGNLVLDQWVDKDGQKRSKLKVNLQELQFLDGKPPEGMGGAGEGTGMRAPRPAAAAPARKPASNFAGNGGASYDEEADMGPSTQGGSGGTEEEIPF
jgi:single-strand DNA-binding protein